MHFSEYIKNVFFNHKLDSQVFNEMIMKRTIKKDFIFTNKTVFSHFLLYQKSSHFSGKNFEMLKFYKILYIGIFGNFVKKNI